MLQLRPSAFRAVDETADAGPAFHLLRWDALTPREEAAWNDLGRAAESPSVFAEPWLMRRSLVHCDVRRQALLAVVADEDGRWIGALPVAAAARQGRSPVPAWAAWSHPNQFVGSPLVRCGEAERFWSGLLDGLGRHGTRRVAIGLGQLPVDDGATRALLDLCTREGRDLVIDRRWNRACLDAGAGAERPEQCGKQKSRIRGLERKLAAEVGEAELDIARTPERIETALEAFLELEQSGWKGQAGSALACAEETRNFFVDVARAAAGKGRLEVAVLSVGGQALAMATQLIAEGRIYGFKAAYDEAHARFAPGLLLLDRLTRHYLDNRAGEIDSCAAPEQQPVSRLWPARREFVDCRVALGGPVRARLFAAMLACEHAARRLSRRR